MNIPHSVLISVFVLAGMTFTATESRGQADPSWLSSWNEAQKSRPLTMIASGRIAANNEPGIPLIIHGRLFGPDGTPAGGVVVHAYHRDRDGFDFGPGDNALTTWKLQGWVKTDTDGRFKFKTIRPAADHLGREGAHIHFTIDAVDFGRQWAPTIFFSEDPLVTEDQRRQSRKAGELGWIREVQTVDGVQLLNVRFRLKEKADF